MQVIDDTLLDLDQLISKDFGNKRAGSVARDFVDWLHYRARRVPMLPRQVFVSREVSKHQRNLPAIEKIRSRLVAGLDVAPWLSARTLTHKNDHRADMMFNDWQILHFHLGGVYQAPTLIRRSGPLLYAHITAEQATLLDVQPHGAWTQTALLEILLSTNAPALERYEAFKVTPMRLTDEQYSTMRKRGTNSLIEIAGRAFMPGMALMSTGHAMRIEMYGNWFLRSVEKLRSELEANQIEQHLKRPIYERIGVPVRLGAYYDHGGLSIIDKNRHGLVLYQMKPLE